MQQIKCSNNTLNDRYIRFNLRAHAGYSPPKSRPRTKIKKRLTAAPDNDARLILMGLSRYNGKPFLQMLDGATDGGALS